METGFKQKTKKALVASGKEAFVKLREAAGIYGGLLDSLKAHKWNYIKLATDDALRVAHKLKTEKRSIDILREAYMQNDGEAPSHAKANKPGAVAVAGLIMHLRLINGRGGSLLAGHYTGDIEKTLEVVNRLRTAGLRPNVVTIGPYYMIYIAMSDLLKLAEEDDAVRRAVAQYLTEKAKNGTPKQREIAEKILQRHPFLNPGTPTKPIIAPTRQTTPPEICVKTIERSRDGGPAGIFRRVSPEPGTTRA